LSPERQLEQKPWRVSDTLAWAKLARLGENTSFSPLFTYASQIQTISSNTQFIFIRTQTSNMHLNHETELKHTICIKNANKSSSHFLDRCYQREQTHRRAPQFHCNLRSWHEGTKMTKLRP